MREAKARGRGQLLLVLGVAGFSLVLLGTGISFAPSAASRLLPPIVGPLIPVVGLLLAIFVWNRSAHDLAMMARGDMDRSTRLSTDIARRFGKVGTVFGAVLILCVALILVAGYVILGPNPSGP